MTLVVVAWRDRQAQTSKHSLELNNHGDSNHIQGQQQREHGAVRAVSDCHHSTHGTGVDLPKNSGCHAGIFLKNPIQQAHYLT
jgi:hypothetical protein